MKKDLALALFVFCLTLVASFAMDQRPHDPNGKNMDIEKTADRAIEITRKLKYSGSRHFMCGNATTNAPCTIPINICDLLEFPQTKQKLRRSKILVEQRIRTQRLSSGGAQYR